MLLALRFSGEVLYLLILLAWKLYLMFLNLYLLLPWGLYGLLLSLFLDRVACRVTFQLRLSFTLELCLNYWLLLLLQILLQLWGCGVFRFFRFCLFLRFWIAQLVFASFAKKVLWIYVIDLVLLELLPVFLVDWALIPFFKKLLKNISQRIEISVSRTWLIICQWWIQMFKLLNFIRSHMVIGDLMWTFGKCKINYFYFVSILFK